MWENEGRVSHELLLMHLHTTANLGRRRTDNISISDDSISYPSSRNTSNHKLLRGQTQAPLYKQKILHDILIVKLRQRLATTIIYQVGQADSGPLKTRKAARVFSTFLTGSQSNQSESIQSSHLFNLRILLAFQSFQPSNPFSLPKRCQRSRT